MKASEQYIPVVLFIMQYKVVLTFEIFDEIIWCDHSNESLWVVLSCGTVYYAVQGGSNFWVCGWNPMVWPFTWWPVLFIMLFFTSHRSNYLNAWNKLLLVFSVTPFKMDQNKNKTFQQKKSRIWEMKGCVIQVREIFRITRYPRKCSTQIYRDLYGDATLMPNCMGTNISYKTVNFFFEELVTLK